MDFNKKKKNNVNIFNKEYNHPYYYMVLDETISEKEVKELNELLHVARVNSKETLDKIIKFYCINFQYESLNWLDIYNIDDMSYIFSNSNYMGDIS